MGLILDVIIYVVFEFLGEFFVSVFTAFIPSRKLSIKDYRIIFVVGLIISVFLFVGLVYGIILLVESNAQSVLGWIFVSLAVIYVLTGIVFKLINKN